MGEEVVDQDDEQVLAIANFLVGDIVYIAEIVVSPFYSCERLVNEVEGICDRVLGDICNGVMGFGELQRRSVLSVGKDGSTEPALSRDK